jgi:rubrerythrin
MDTSTGAGVASRTLTLQNLQTAFNGESNARACYLAFAVQANHEGYGPVASLFRAAARAEEIHAANHASVLSGLGEEPVAHIEVPLVMSTHENLKAAIRGETYEREEMYPAFIVQAEAEGNRKAENTFYLACEVEGEHARFFTRALVDLDKLRGGSAVYYVCPICGFTAAQTDFDVCPVCSTPAEEYEMVK